MRFYVIDLQPALALADPTARLTQQCRRYIIAPADTASQREGAIDNATALVARLARLRAADARGQDVTVVIDERELIGPENQVIRRTGVLVAGLRGRGIVKWGRG